MCVCLPVASLFQLLLIIIYTATLHFLYQYLTLCLIQYNLIALISCVYVCKTELLSLISHAFRWLLFFFFKKKSFHHFEIGAPIFSPLFIKIWFHIAKIGFCLFRCYFALVKYMLYFIWWLSLGCNSFFYSMRLHCIKFLINFAFFFFSSPHSFFFSSFSILNISTTRF